jgi:hypothetical protein
MHRERVVSKQSLIKGVEDQCVRIAIENAGGYSGLKLQYEAKRDHLTLWRKGYTPVYIVDRVTKFSVMKYLLDTPPHLTMPLAPNLIHFGSDFRGFYWRLCTNSAKS